MFQSKTGWAGVVVALVGALTAVDVLPLVSAFLTETVGPSVAHTIGTGLTLVGAVIAKLADPKPQGGA